MEHWFPNKQKNFKICKLGGGDQKCSHCGQIHGLLLCIATMQETVDSTLCFHELKYIVTAFDIGKDGKIRWSSNSANTDFDRARPDTTLGKEKSQCILDAMQSECSEQEQQIVSKAVQEWKKIPEALKENKVLAPFDCSVHLNCRCRLTCKNTWFGLFWPKWNVVESGCSSNEVCKCKHEETKACDVNGLLRARSIKSFCVPTYVFHNGM